ncbi:MAG: protein-glutamate O-methyltransferase CheR [Flavobacteriales bacterium]|nr:protein-glutamate O-methyltransferase CheR [Flavobacteriales bacterium]
MSNFVVVGEAEVDRIIEVVFRTANINYSEYSRDSVTRRIQRVVDRTSCVNVDELIFKIENEAEYLAFFLNEMTVNVTEMFRDPSFFTVIQNHVIPKLSKKNPLNIWHAGCSSGEEVYSLAIMLHQANLLERSDITATDINRTVLKQAAAGKYSTASLVSFQHNYDQIDGSHPLSDYYSKANGNAIFNDFLKNRLTFLEHDLEQAKIIGKFDLIMCRNTLIYFQKSLQSKVIHLFKESLTSGGYLCLGSKESLIFSDDRYAFEVVDAKEKIYRKI